jgi:hypothetical protein
MGANPLDQAALDAAMKAHTEALDVADLPGAESPEHQD